MKKVFSVLVGLLMVASFAACGPGDGSMDSMRAKTLVIDEDSTDEIQVPTDTVAVFEFTANISTGHAWHFDTANTTFKLLYEEFLPESDLLGAPGIQKFHVAGVTNGYDNVQFNYSSPAGEQLSSKVFSAYSQGTFSASYAIPEEVRIPARQYDAGSTYAPASSYASCPAVRNQGSCGSCWAFSTVGALECKSGISGDYSEQYLVSCNSDGWSCNGGWFAHAYHVNQYVSSQSAAGYVNESVKPYTATNGSCSANYAKAGQGSSWGYLTSGGTGGMPTLAQIQQGIDQYGAVSVAVYADSAFQSYSGGIFDGSAYGTVNHAVTLIGYSGSVLTLRNSWGSSWGESGNMRIYYGSQRIGQGASYIIAGGSPDPTPTPSPDASCVGYCGGQSPSGCYCDSVCVSYGDCCPDYQSACVSPTPTPTPAPTPTPTPTPAPTPTPSPSDSCYGYCGGQAPGGCWCDSYCTSYGDCCADYNTYC